MKETPVAQRVRLLSAQLNMDLWRNNSGAFKDDFGNMIRFGLANDSAEYNKVVKSSDLIGITPIIITPDMLGQIVGVFTAIETKASDWHMTPSDKRAKAQEAFHNIVRRAGGFAGFATSADDVYRITGRVKL